MTLLTPSEFAQLHSDVHPMVHELLAMDSRIRLPELFGKIPARPFFAALAREVRTRAIQTHITVFASEKEKMKSTAYDQFNNSYWKDLAEEHLPFGRFKNMQDLTSWMAMLRERTHKAWSLDRIHSEWRTRLTCIQNWMETAS